MVLENLEVQHKAFGKGTVVLFNGKYITVDFEKGRKTFVYPDAFETFLTLPGGTIPEDIQKDISESNRKKREIAEAKQAENRRSMDHGIVMPGKDLTAEADEDEVVRETESEEI